MKQAEGVPRHRQRGLGDALGRLARNPVEESLSTGDRDQQMLARGSGQCQVRRQRLVGYRDEFRVGVSGPDDLVEPRGQRPGLGFTEIDRHPVYGSGGESGQHTGGEIVDITAGPEQVARPNRDAPSSGT